MATSKAEKRAAARAKAASKVGSVTYSGNKTSSSSGSSSSSSSSGATTREEFINSLFQQQEAAKPKINVFETIATPTFQQFHAENLKMLSEISRRSGDSSGAAAYAALAQNATTSQKTKAQQIAETKQKTAQELLIEQYQDAGFFGKLWQKLDYGAFGYLPGGISPDLVRAWDAERKLEETKVLTRAQTELDQAKMAADYSKKSWYEYLGIGYSSEERAFQDALKLTNQTSLLKSVGAEIGEGVKASIAPTNTNWTNIALIGAAAILGIAALKSK